MAEMTEPILKAVELIKKSPKDEILISEQLEVILYWIKKLEGSNFWTNWVYPNGANPEEIQNELLDYHLFMENCAEVYMRVTNGRISKINTKAYEVISEFENYLLEEIENAIIENRENRE